MIAKDVIKEFTDDGVKSLERDKEASEQGTYQRENATGMTKKTRVNHTWGYDTVQKRKHRHCY